MLASCIELCGVVVSAACEGGPTPSAMLWRRVHRERDQEFDFRLCHRLMVEHKQNTGFPLSLKVDPDH